MEAGIQITGLAAPHTPNLCGGVSSVKPTIYLSCQGGRDFGPLSLLLARRFAGQQVTKTPSPRVIE